MCISILCQRASNQFGSPNGIFIQLVELTYEKTHVDKHSSITSSQVVQNGSVIKESQVGHVFSFLEFRRIHFLNLISLEDFLKIQHHLFLNPKIHLVSWSDSYGDIVSVSFGNKTLNVSFFLIRNPAIFLRIIRTRLVLNYRWIIV